MSDLNSLTITGRLTRDSEQRYTQSGVAIVSFSVANTTGFGDKEKTHYFSCAVFGKRAESEKFFKALVKGTPVTVIGEISLNEYQNNNGENKASLKVFVKDITFVSTQPKQTVQQDRSPNPGGQQIPDEFSDNIPFSPLNKRMVI